MSKQDEPRALRSGLQFDLFAGEGGTERIRLKTTRDVDVQVPEHNEEIEMDPSLVDVVADAGHTYRFFWNKRYFGSEQSLQRLLAEDGVLAILSIDKYAPIVIRYEAMDTEEIGFAAYRADGKVLMTGYGVVHPDRVDFRFTPVYRRVKFGFFCAHCGGAASKPPPKAGEK